MTILRHKQGAVRSPCIAICELNRENICKGCFRSSDEIANWSRLDDSARQEILQKAYQRALHTKPSNGR